MALDSAQLASFARDVAWAFGLKDRSGAPLAFEEPRSDEGARRILLRLRGGLATVRPVARAASVAEVLFTLEAPRATAKARRRALAELVELVAQGTHRRAKRQERARILGELVLLFELDAALGKATSGADAAGAFAAYEASLA